MLTTDTKHQETLLDVLDDLTLHKFDHIAQRVGLDWKVKTIKVPALLHLMRNAVMPSNDRDRGSASTKDTRSPADLDAMFEYAKMTSAAASWCHAAGVVPTRDPVDDLRAWHAVTLADNDRADSFYRGVLKGWRALIRNHLEPPERFTAPHACPVCGTTSWGDAINGGDRFPIEVRYRLDDVKGMVDEVATCRISECGTKWIGHDAIVELAEEMRDRAGTDSTSTVSSTGDES